MVTSSVYVFEASPGTEARPEWVTFLQSITKATGTAVHSGRQVEDPGKIWVLNDVPSSQAQSIAEALSKVTTTTGLKTSARYTVYFANNDRSALTAPITEISIGFFSVANPAASGFEQIVREFSAKAEASGIPGRAQGTNSGWTVDEDVVFTTLLGEMAHGVGFFSVLGWQSQAAHYNFNGTDFVKENAGPIATAGAEGWQIVHVDFDTTTI